MGSRTRGAVEPHAVIRFEHESVVDPRLTHREVGLPPSRRRLRRTRHRRREGLLSVRAGPQEDPAHGCRSAHAQPDAHRLAQPRVLVGDVPRGSIVMDGAQPGRKGAGAGDHSAGHRGASREPGGAGIGGHHVFHGFFLPGALPLISMAPRWIATRAGRRNLARSAVILSALYFGKPVKTPSAWPRVARTRVVGKDYR
jgi:hypothetical protein